MRLRQLTTARLADPVSEGVRRSHHDAIRELQGLVQTLLAAGTDDDSSSAVVLPSAGLKTGNYSMQAGEVGVLFDMSGGGLQCNLPPVADGLLVAIARNSLASSLTINPNSGETVDDDTSMVLLSGAFGGTSYGALLWCDGVNWWSLR